MCYLIGSRSMQSSLDDGEHFRRGFGFGKALRCIANAAGTV